MSSYYKKINGLNYDRVMIETADKSSKKKGDGRISLSDAKILIKEMKDGSKITDIELKTLNYILENYNFTESALKYIESNLSDGVDSKNAETQESSDYNRAALLQNDYPRQEQKPKSGKMKYLIIFLCALLLILLLLADFVCKKDTVKDETPANITQNNETALAINNEAAKIETNAAENAILNTEPAQGENNKGQSTEPVTGKAENNTENNAESVGGKYTVKAGDTLVKISQSIYGDYKFSKNIYNANRDKIKNPNLLRQGLTLTIPEKQ